MPVYSTFSRPCYDKGATTNYTLPALWLRPVISAFVCSIKGHNFNGYGTADGSWEPEAEYRSCARCAMRRFENVESKEKFDLMMANEHARWDKIMSEKAAAAR